MSEIINAEKSTTEVVETEISAIEKALELLNSEAVSKAIDTMDGMKKTSISLTHQTKLEMAKGTSKNFMFLGTTSLTMKRDEVKEGEEEDEKIEGVPILMDSKRTTFAPMNKMLIDAFNQSLAKIGGFYKITFNGEENLGQGKKYHSYKVERLTGE